MTPAATAPPPSGVGNAEDVVLHVVVARIVTIGGLELAHNHQGINIVLAVAVIVRLHIIIIIIIIIMIVVTLAEGYVRDR